MPSVTRKRATAALTGRVARHYAGVRSAGKTARTMHLPLKSTRLIASAMLCLATATVASAGEQADDASFRVFLRDGTAVAIYGDFARVGDRIVFSMAVGGDESPGRLQVVNLPATAVDLEKTEQYALSVRAARYATMQGEADYAALTAEVARAVNLVASTNSVLERLQITERARSLVATWLRDHYGYRAADVRQIQALLDEAVSDLRAQAGINQFDLNLVAGVEPPPPPSLPRPTPAEAIEQVLRVARASDNAAERVSLLQAAIRVLDRPSAGMAPRWVKQTQRSAGQAIAAEMRIDRAYRDLAHSALGRALEAASRADATAVQQILADVRQRDERLGRKRPDEVASLVAAVEAQLDAARRLRLVRDRWQVQYPALRRYVDLARGPIDQVARAKKSLDSIRQLAGPDPAVLRTLRTRLASAAQTIARLTPPPDAAGVHATLTSACQMALRSVEVRQRAIESGDLQVAWDASAAAAGALMLLTQVQEQLQTVLRPPGLS